MEKRNFVTIADLSREKILYMLKMAEEFEKRPNRDLLKEKIVATLFFEPSTRTRLSFETAANRLGAKVIGFADPKVTSGTKGETLKDTILMVSNYADVIVMRHHIEGAAQYASEISPVPIVNAGDGAHQHPSQCMLDLYSIYKTQGTLENLNIYLVGDLKYGRTVHSLIMAMRHFNPTFHFIAPKELTMPNEYKQYCKAHGIKFQEHTAFNDKIIADADIIYMTRVQKERFSDLMEYERVKDVYILNRDMLHLAKDNMRILHPLPRVNEIAQDVDDDPHAYYIQQAKNGLFAREAIFADVLGFDYEEIKGKSLLDICECRPHQTDAEKLILQLEKVVETPINNSTVLDITSASFEGIITYQYIVRKTKFCTSLGIDPNSELDEINAKTRGKRLALYTFDIDVSSVYEGKSALHFISEEYKSFADKKQFHIATNKERKLTEVCEAVKSQIEQGIANSLWKLV